MGDARERDGDAERCDVAVLAVHGIGTQSKESTLRDFVDSITGLLTSFGGAVQPPRSLTFELADDPDNEFVRLRVPMLASEPGTSQRWIIGEAWWAEAFDAPDRGETSRWLVDAGPFFAYYFAVRLWRRFAVDWWAVAAGFVAACAAAWFAGAAATGHALGGPGIAAGIGLLALVISMVREGKRLGPVIVTATFLVVYPIASVLTVAIVVLYLVGLLPGKWSKGVRAFQVTLSRSVGDSSALISSHRREAAMYEAIIAATGKLIDAADDGPTKPTPLVIVAHSQGAALMYRLFRRDEFRRKLHHRRVTLMTYGAAIHPLELLQRRIDGDDKRGRVQGVIGLAASALLLVVIERLAMNAANAAALVCGVASLALAAVSFWMVKSSTSTADGTRRDADPSTRSVPSIETAGSPSLDRTFRWIDFWAPWDPVPNGPLDLALRPTSNAPSRPGTPTPDGRATSCRVSNEHQPWRDHVVYRMNDEDVVSRWLAEIAATGGASDIDVAAFADMPATPARWTADRARAFRLWRGQGLLATQLALLGAVLLAAARRWRDLPQLGRWLTERAPNFVEKPVSAVANAIPKQVRPYLGASKDHTAHLYGLGAAAAGFAAGCLVLGFLMAVWQSRPARLFANAVVSKRIGAPLRGVLTSLAFLAVIVAAVVIAVG